MTLVATVCAEQGKGWLWNVLSVWPGSQSFDLWLCGDEAHPWHCRVSSTTKAGAGRAVDPSLELVSMFRCYFESGGNPLIPYKEVPQHFIELCELLGEAVSLS